ncbi:DUF6266 family protein [Mesonia aquimarina]|uniref:DUF6266 family protein n=1 Tax=Mesonia aquimarina TaxID=1504967 RepID=UPI000EF5C6E9|nr:DUF6266 family protein [Mesonia aquimarina]
MARLLNNPFGNISGKAASIVFKRNKNGTYISTLPTPTLKPPSTAQSLQQSKMTIVMRFLQALKFLFKSSYFPLHPKKSAFNHAKSYYLKEALTHTPDGYEINYAKAIVSYGTIRVPEQVHAQRPAADHLELQWLAQTRQAFASAKDQVLLVLYQEKTQEVYFQTQAGFREDAYINFSIPKKWQVFTFHLWMAYIQPEAKQASVSVYLGEF